MRTGRVRPTAWSALTASLLLLLAACAGGSSTDDGSAGPVSHEYLPGLAAYPHVPDGVVRAPVVVMVPGGSWRSADPAGYAGLAESLADAGLVAVPVTIRAGQDGVTFPVPVEDVLCALADGAATARDAGVEPTVVVLLGHSSGAHLSAVAALAPDTVAPTCEDPLVEADALIGLAGPYDIRDVSGMAETLVGVPPAGDPQTWARANPVFLADRRTDLPALLLHGDADDVVPVDATRAFSAALERGGHATTVEVVPGADHASIYSAEVAGPLVTDWVLALAG